MVFRVHFRHMASSHALQKYTEEKLGERLAKYAFKVTEARVTFSVEGGIDRASCHVVAAHGVSIAVESEDAMSMYAAIDRLADKLDARLRRRKEKMRSHRTRTGLYEAWAAEELLAAHG